MKDKYVEEFFKKEAYKKVIEQYKLLQSLPENLGDEYIKIKYKINPSKIRALYEIIPEEEKNLLEKEITNEGEER